MCTDEGRRSEPVGDGQAERTRQRAGYFHGRGWALAAPTQARTVDHSFMGLDVDLDEGGFLGAVRRIGLPAACAGACVRRRVDLFAALLEPYQANRTLGVVSKMMNLAEAWGLRPDRSNPCYHIRKYKEGKRERFLTAEELARLGSVLRAGYGYRLGNVLDLNLEATRRDPVNDEAPEQGLMLRGEMRW